MQTTINPLEPHVHPVPAINWPNKLTEIITLQNQSRMPQKPKPTKEMMTEAIKTLSKGRKSRHGFSFLGLRKYIFEHFLHSKRELIRRMIFVKRFFKEALETGDLQTIKGNGLNGSFRVPSTSAFRSTEQKRKPTPNPLSPTMDQKAKKMNSKMTSTVYKKNLKKRGPKPKNNSKLTRKPKKLNITYSAK